MPSKKQLTYLKEAKELVNKRKIAIKNFILIKKDISALLEDESTEKSWIFKKNIL